MLCEVLGPALQDPLPRVVCGPELLGAEGCLHVAGEVGQAVELAVALVVPGNGGDVVEPGNQSTVRYRPAGTTEEGACVCVCVCVCVKNACSSRLIINWVLPLIPLLFDKNCSIFSSS